MKKAVNILAASALFFFNICLYGQDPVEQSGNEQMMETILSGGEEETTSMEWETAEQVLDLNTAGEVDLLGSGLFRFEWVRNLLDYRKRLGPFLSIYELQAIPGWEADWLRQIKHFITVSNNRKIKFSPASWKKEGEQRLLIRWAGTLEKNRGIKEKAYAGAGFAQMYRYRFQWQGRIQFGFTWEKDIGEKKGFFSAHLQLRDLGRIKLLVIGDYTISQGQGLVQWQGMRFGKGGDPAGIKRQGTVLRSYSSAGEVFFHRGMGFIWQNRAYEVTGFISHRFLSGNKEQDDSGETIMTSISSSGYHRTVTEIEGRNVLQRWAGGGTVRWRKKEWQVSANANTFMYSIPIEPNAAPYRLYAFRGKKGTAVSLDLSGSLRSIHFFAESAVCHTGKPAILAGLLFSPDKKMDFALMARKIAPGYISPEAQAVTQASQVQNEQGILISIRGRPRDRWIIDTYLDCFSFPWLRYQVNGRSVGNEFQSSLIHTPRRGIEILARFRTSNRWENGESIPGTVGLTAVRQKSIRFQISLPFSAVLWYRQRMEWVKVGKGRGGLLFADIRWKPVSVPWSGSFRLQWAGTDGYDSRIYVFENDVLYASSLSAFYEKQFRYYLVLTGKIRKKIQLSFKFSQSLFVDKQSIGSGWGEIKGNHRSDWRVQIIYADVR
ncbi:MAG: helix-hairpin-helix domain-containing protein [Chitinophagaceae bacterium]|nr:helix-hairpin-helix domain-containing protein [Chitinophagaceae bacterium]